MYPWAVMLLLGASGNYVYNVYLLVLNLLSGFSMYFCAKRIFGDRWTGAIAAMLYILAPYHITDLYLRQALGEAAAMAADGRLSDAKTLAVLLRAGRLLKGEV